MHVKGSSDQDRLARILSEDVTPEQPHTADNTDVMLLAQLANDLSSLRPAPLTPEARAAMRLRVLNAVAASAPSTGMGANPWWRPRLLRVRMALVVVASALTLVGGSVGALTAGAASLPGDPLYGLKLAREHVVLSLATSDGARADAYANQAAHRIDEATRLAGTADQSAIDALSNAAARAIDTAESLATQPDARGDVALPARLRALEQERQRLSATGPSNVGKNAESSDGERRPQEPEHVAKPATPTKAGGNEIPQGPRVPTISNAGSDGDGTLQKTPKPGPSPAAGGEAGPAAGTGANADGSGQQGASPKRSDDGQGKSSTAQANDGQSVGEPAGTGQPANGWQGQGQGNGTPQGQEQPAPTATKTDTTGSSSGGHPTGGDQRQPTKTPSPVGHGKP